MSLGESGHDRIRSLLELTARDIRRAGPEEEGPGLGRGDGLRRARPGQGDRQAPLGQDPQRQAPQGLRAAPGQQHGRHLVRRRDRLRPATRAEPGPGPRRRHWHLRLHRAQPRPDRGAPARCAVARVAPRGARRAALTRLRLDRVVGARARGQRRRSRRDPRRARRPRVGRCVPRRARDLRRRLHRPRWSRRSPRRLGRHPGAAGDQRRPCWSCTTRVARPARDHPWRRRAPRPDLVVGRAPRSDLVVGRAPRSDVVVGWDPRSPRLERSRARPDRHQREGHLPDPERSGAARLIPLENTRGPGRLAGAPFLLPVRRRETSSTRRWRRGARRRDDVGRLGQGELDAVGPTRARRRRPWSRGPRRRRAAAPTAAPFAAPLPPPGDDADDRAERGRAADDLGVVLVRLLRLVRHGVRVELDDAAVEVELDQPRSPCARAP